MILSARATAILCFSFLAACASTRGNGPSPDPKAPDAASSPTSGDEPQVQRVSENEVSSQAVEENIEKPYKSSYGEIALDQNAMVDKWIAYFQGRGRSYMQSYLSRSGRYLPMMKNVLREKGLPEDLVFIALIESGFSPRAHSRANAVGYWQFIRSTGKRFGLKVDTFIDERRDPVLSTRAAAEYFKTLYGLFQSWHLAMAAYNVGELRVKRAVTRHYTRDYWELVKKRRSFPAETKQYVAKFIAATLISKNPAQYGFMDIEFEDPLSYDTVTLKNAISLSKLAGNLGVDVEELQLLNPKFRTDFVPLASGEETVVRIPVGMATDALAALSLSVTNQPKVVQAEYYYYRIRRGDTLSTVAHKHRTTVSNLRRLNSLTNRSLLRVGRSLKVPDPGGDGVKTAVEEDSASGATAGRDRAAAVESAAVDPEYHTVRNGENLSVIAQRYRKSVGDLLRLNGLTNRSILRQGQKLRVREGAPEPNSSVRLNRRPLVLGQFGRSPSARQLAPKVAAGLDSRVRRRHVVRRGETLFDVSKRYGVSLHALARANRVKLSYRVLAGERLLIP